MDAQAERHEGAATYRRTLRLGVRALMGLTSGTAAVALWWILTTSPLGLGGFTVLSAAAAAVSTGLFILGLRVRASALSSLGLWWAGVVGLLSGLEGGWAGAYYISGASHLVPSEFHPGMSWLLAWLVGTVGLWAALFVTVTGEPHPQGEGSDVPSTGAPIPGGA